MQGLPQGQQSAYFPSTSVTKKKKGFYNVAYHLWLLLRLFRCTSKLKIAPTKNFERLQANWPGQEQARIKDATRTKKRGASRCCCYHRQDPEPTPLPGPKCIYPYTRASSTSEDWLYFFFHLAPSNPRTRTGSFFAFLVANWMILRNVTYEVNHGRTFVAAFNDPSRVHPQRPAVF